MTVSDAIERAEGIYRYAGEPLRLIVWLSELEQRISLELFHKEKKDETTIDSVLTAPDAYAELYPLYLAMKSAFVQDRQEKYNDLARCFEAAYSEYIDYVNRTRKPTHATHYKIL